MSVTMKCQLISHTPNPEEIVTKAGKLCYSAVGVDEIGDKQTSESIHRFVNMLSSMGHESPIEHVTFTFAVEGISRACTHQLVRHRIASYSQQSQRYVNLDKTFKYITPNDIKNNEVINELFVQAMDNSFNSYVEISRKLLEHKVLYFAQEKGIPTFNLSVDMIESIVKTNYKKEYSSMVKSSIENARAVLPNACETKIVFTMNARTLMNFFKHRHCKRAQEEIRELATIMLEQVRQVAPTLFKYAGASCQYTRCIEGAMTCGKPYERIDIIR